MPDEHDEIPEDPDEIQPDDPADAQPDMDESLSPHVVPPDAPKDGQ